MFRFPLLTSLLSRKLKKYNPDHTIISSFAAAKNIQNAKSKIQNKSTVTLYLHSPMQYIRENYHDNIQKLRFPIKQLYQLATYYLRPRDRKNRHYDQIFFNSEYTQTIAEKLYHMK